MIPNHRVTHFPVHYDCISARIGPFLLSPTNVGLFRQSSAFNTSSLPMTTRIVSAPHTNASGGHRTSGTSSSRSPCSETLRQKPPSSFLIADILRSSRETQQSTVTSQHDDVTSLKLQHLKTGNCSITPCSGGVVSWKHDEEQAEDDDDVDCIDDDDDIEELIEVDDDDVTQDRSCHGNNGAHSWSSGSNPLGALIKMIRQPFDRNASENGNEYTTTTTGCY